MRVETVGQLVRELELVHFDSRLTYPLDVKVEWTEVGWVLSKVTITEADSEPK
jgi:hypothetical protein